MGKKGERKIKEELNDVKREEQQLLLADEENQPKVGEDFESNILKEMPLSLIFKFD